MCLTILDGEKKRNKIKNSIPEEGLKVYKLVGVKYGKYFPILMHDIGVFTEGVNKAITSGRLYSFNQNRHYVAGFHFWMSRKSAEKYLEKIMRLKVAGSLNPKMIHELYEIIECIVKKSWVTATGKDGQDGYKRNALVAKKAIFPKFKEIG